MLKETIVKIGTVEHQRVTWERLAGQEMLEVLAWLARTTQVVVFEQLVLVRRRWKDIARKYDARLGTADWT